jgi:hypothetical protein
MTVRERTADSSPAVHCWGMGFFELLESVKRTAEISSIECMGFSRHSKAWTMVGFSRPFHGLDTDSFLIPPINRWATIIRPLRGLLSVPSIPGESQQKEKQVDEIQVE